LSKRSAAKRQKSKDKKAAIDIAGRFTTSYVPYSPPTTQRKTDEALFSDRVNLANSTSPYGSDPVAKHNSKEELGIK
jgi:hypothetical protein